MSDMTKTLLAYCTARTSNYFEAEDLAQDMILEIYKSAGNIRNADAFYGFMWAVAGNVYKQWRRNKAKRKECELPENLWFEPETEAESEPSQEGNPPAEDTGKTETEGSNEQEEVETEKVTGNEEVKQEDLPVGEEIEAGELLEDMKAVFDSALNFIVPEEELDAASMVSNAILNKTDISINYVEDGICNVTVKYPNAAEALKTAEAQLAADASQEELDAMLNALAQAIENGEVETIEKTLDVSVIEIGEFRTIEWTKELYDAITGGLYSIE